MRAGYLFGLSTDLGLQEGHSAVPYSNAAGIDLLPVWAGARWFVLDPDSGPYAEAELGLNVVMPYGSGPRLSLVANQDTITRLGFDVGLGYIFEKVPVRVGAAFTHLNLVPAPTESSTDEHALFGVTFYVGYGFRL